MRRKNEFRYLELAATLRALIKSGAIKPGEFLISEHDLCEKYEMSRTSVRMSLQELLNEGLVVKIPGKGTIVSHEIALESDDSQKLVIATAFPSMYAAKALPILERKFRSKYPGIQLQFISLPLDSSSLQEMLDRINPDLVIVTDQDVHQMNKEHFYTISELLDLEGDIPDVVKRAFTIEGVCYAAPVTYSPIFLSYNPVLFERMGLPEPQPGWTKEAFLNTAQQLTDLSDETGLARSYGFSFSSAISRWLVLALKEGFSFRSGADGRYDLAKLTSSLEWIQNLVYKYKVCPIYALSNHEMGQRMFEEGKVGMILTSTLAFKMGQLSFEPKISRLPGHAGNSLLIGNGVLVNRSTSQLPYAKLFIEMALDPEFQAEIMQETNILSIYTNINETLRSEQQLEDLGISRSSIETAMFLQDLFADVAIMDDIMNEMIHYWNGTEGAESLAVRLGALLEEAQSTGAAR